MWLFKPVRSSNCKNILQFVLRILAQQFTVKIIVAILLTFLLQETYKSKIVITNPLLVIIGIIVLAPILETLFFQTLMIELTKRVKKSYFIQFCAGMIPFAIVHFFHGIIIGIAAGVVGGFFFTYTYLEWRKESRWKATGVTALTHCLHNTIVLPGFFVMSSFQ